jgi:Ca2+:H+ antiporter
LLAVAVTVIEVGLIVSIMLSGADGSDRVARDTVSRLGHRHASG